MDTSDTYNAAELRAFVARRAEANRAAMADEAHDSTMVIDEQQLTGVWKRDAQGAFRSAPGHSLRYPSIPIDFTKRQAE